MEIIKLISAFGVGAILTKIIDVFWVQPFLEKKEKRSWLREKRFDSYVKLTSNLLSFGLNNKPENNPFQHLAEVSPSILLTKDDEFFEKVYSFVAKRNLMFSIQDKKSTSKEDPEKLYNELVEESKALIKELKLCLHEEQ
jgi:hypothetical protein